MNFTANCRFNSGERKPNMKHKIGIVWGEDPSNSGFDLYEYSFNTQAELDAFMHGVDEMDAWQDYPSGEKGYNVIGKNGDFATLADLKKEYE